MFAAMKDEKNNRQKPGRKVVTDKAIPITVYIKESVVERLGDGDNFVGKDKARSLAIAAISEFDEKERGLKQ